MNQVIIYGSQYGSTYRYAKQLSEQTNITAVGYKEAPDLSRTRTIIYMGGLYAYHEDGPRFLVLTVPANQSVSPVHSRMPLLLQKEHIRLWLRDLPAALELLGTSQPMLQAEPMEQESAQLCFSSV